MEKLFKTVGYSTCLRVEKFPKAYIPIPLFHVERLFDRLLAFSSTYVENSLFFPFFPQIFFKIRDVEKHSFLKIKQEKFIFGLKKRKETFFLIAFPLSFHAKPIRFPFLPFVKSL